MKLATSTGFAIRPMGIVPRICFMISGLSITPLIKGVSIAPSTVSMVKRKAYLEQEH